MQILIITYFSLLPFFSIWRKKINPGYIHIHRLAYKINLFSFPFTFPFLFFSFLLFFSIIFVNLLSWVGLCSTWTGPFWQLLWPRSLRAPASGLRQWMVAVHLDSGPSNGSWSHSELEGNRWVCLDGPLCWQLQKLLVQPSCFGTVAFPLWVPTAQSRSYTHQLSECRACAVSSPCIFDEAKYNKAAAHNKI